MDRLTSPGASDAPTPTPGFDPLGFAPAQNPPFNPLNPLNPPSTAGGADGFGEEGATELDPTAHDADAQPPPARRSAQRPRPRIVTNVNDISRVPDRVGDRVREGFADFLQTCVP